MNRISYIVMPMGLSLAQETEMTLHNHSYTKPTYRPTNSAIKPTSNKNRPSSIHPPPLASLGLPPHRPPSSQAPTSPNKPRT